MVVHQHSLNPLVTHLCMLVDFHVGLLQGLLRGATLTGPCAQHDAHRGSWHLALIILLQYNKLY
jgi:hypothetical protein